jgi:sialidase-1
MFFEKIDECVVYENPKPVLRSRCAIFPGMVRLPSGELLTLFELGEAFESADGRTVLSRSQDSGRTWQFQGELYDSARLGLPYPVSESLKPLLLRDGTLVATGYRFLRKDPEQTIGNPETGGVLPAEVVVCLSKDEGRNWTLPRVIEHSFPEPVELSGPCIESASGDLLGTGALFKMWDGSNPSGSMGVLFRSRDKGRTWTVSERFFHMPGGHVVPFESRIVEMQPGTLVTLSWAYDLARNRNLPNHVTVSHDNGATWSAPIDTGVGAQASNLLWLEGNRLLTIHAHREDGTGIYLRLVDLTDDRWKIDAEGVIWGNGAPGAKGQRLVDHFQSLKFGQPSLLRLDGDELLAYHWCVENMLYKIKSHRLKLRL